jgi:AraC-like DNA-binding protein
MPMTDLSRPYAELAALISRHAPRDDIIETAIPGLFVLRQSAPSLPHFCAQWPTLALVAQGAKSITLGQETFHYGVGDFMVVSLDLPVIGCVVEASAEKPLLSLGLEIRPDRLRQALDRVVKSPAPVQADGLRGVGVNKVNAPLLEAVLRTMRLLDSPEDIAALAPLYEQEMLYRLLTGPYGPRLIQNITRDSPANRVSRAIEWLREHFAKPLRMEDLASHAGMSISSLHHHFRTVTAMTPMQFQKQLRLNEARRLILVDGMDIGGAGFSVGYASRSQFGLEYARHFGASPSRDIITIRRTGEAGAGSPS